MYVSLFVRIKPRRYKLPDEVEHKRARQNGPHHDRRFHINYKGFSHIQCDDSHARVIFNPMINPKFDKIIRS